MSAGLPDQGIGEIRPAVGGEYRAIQIVVQFLQQGDQTLLVNGLLFSVQGLAGAQLLQDVVHPGQGQAGRLRLLTLAVGIELFGQVADTGSGFGGGIREREGFKAAGFYINHIAFISAWRC